MIPFLVFLVIRNGKSTHCILIEISCIHVLKICVFYVTTKWRILKLAALKQYFDIPHVDIIEWSRKKTLVMPSFFKKKPFHMCTLNMISEYLNIHSFRSLHPAKKIFKKNSVCIVTILTDYFNDNKLLFFFMIHFNILCISKIFFVYIFFSLL